MAHMFIEDMDTKEVVRDATPRDPDKHMVRLAMGIEEAQWTLDILRAAGYDGESDGEGDVAEWGHSLAWMLRMVLNPSEGRS